MPGGVQVHVVPTGSGPAHLLAEVGRPVVEDLGRAQPAHRGGVLGPGRGDDAGAGPGGEGHGGTAHVPCAAPDVDGLPRPQPAVPEQRQPGRRRRVRGGHELVGGDAGGNGVEPVGGDRGVFGEGALPARVPQAVAPHRLSGGEPGRAGAGRRHLAHQVPADDEGQGHRGGVRPGPHEGVHGVGGDGPDPHEHVRGPRRGHGKLAVADGVGRSDGVDVRRVHHVGDGAVHALMLGTARCRRTGGPPGRRAPAAVPRSEQPPDARAARGPRPP